MTDPELPLHCPPPPVRTVEISAHWQTASERLPTWTPGIPYRPMSIDQYQALRGYADPANTAWRHACERRETQEEADGLACPTCATPIGQPCFGPDARSNHPARAMAHWSAQVQAQNATCPLCLGIGYSDGYPCSCPLGMAA
jgi:hypothetical protein